MNSGESSLCDPSVDVLKVGILLLHLFAKWNLFNWENGLSGELKKCSPRIILCIFGQTWVLTWVPKPRACYHLGNHCSPVFCLCPAASWNARKCNWESKRDFFSIVVQRIQSTLLITASVKSLWHFWHQVELIQRNFNCQGLWQDVFRASVLFPSVIFANEGMMFI